jgi:O-antigen/teichoic acid export membrane protein
MGKIKQQGIRNSVFLYLGIILGYINIVILFPRFFDQEVFGLTRSFIAFANVMAILAQLGFSNITIKYFPYFRSEDQRHHGFLFLVLAVPLIGLIVVMGLFWLLQPYILKVFGKDSQLFANNYYWLFPLTLAILYFEALASYARALFHSVVAVGLKEVGIRLGVSAAIFAASLLALDTSSFLAVFTLAYLLPVLVLLGYIAYLGQASLRPDFRLLDRSMRSTLTSYGFFTLAHRLSLVLNKRVDILMLTALADLKQVAIYTIAFYIGNTIMVPSRGLIQISSPVVADAFAKADWQTVDDVYKKTGLNQLLIGSFFFLLIWFSIEPILQIINPDYLQAKMVVLFIGIGKLFSMGTGVNNQVILHSRFYRYNLLFISLLLLFTVSLNFLLIPRFGLVGAAIATMVSIMLNQGIKTLFAWWKMGFHPLSLGTLKVLGIIVVSSIGGYFIPPIQIDFLAGLWHKLGIIAYRSALLATIFGAGVLLLKPSVDVHETLLKTRKRFLGF